MITRLFYTLLLFSLSSFQSFGQKEDSLHALYYFELFQINEYEDSTLAEKYADSALYFAVESGNNDLLGQAYIYYGWLLQDRSKFKASNVQFGKALKYFNKSDNKQGIANAYGNIGNSYFDIGNYGKSLEYQLLSKDVNKSILENNPDENEEYEATSGYTFALHNIGSIYKDIGMYEKALEYEHLSLPGEIKAGSLEGEAISYNTLAAIHKQLKNTDSAVYYFEKALLLFGSDDVNYPYAHAATLQSFATLEGADLTDKRRREMFLQALEFQMTLGDKDGQVRTLLAYASFQFDNLSTDSLSIILNRVNKTIKDFDLGLMKESYFKIRSRYNYRVGEFKLAYDNLSKYVELESLSDERNKTQELVAGDIKHHLDTKRYNDSLTVQNIHAKETASKNEELARVQNIVYLSVIGFIILIVSLLFFISTNRKRKRMNSLLSEKNTLVQEQKAIVDEKNASISDSITYAKRLQSAILPTASEVNKYLPNSFLMYKPKDIVSGDFHWFEVKKDIVFIAAADCTGHGVPGALVSVVCSNALNRVVNEFGLSKPAEILNKTRELVIETFERSEENVVDGMDISLCAVNLKSKIISFSGANNPLWIVRNSVILENNSFDSVHTGENATLLELKGDKQPVGVYINQKSFTQKEISIEEGDTIYIFTDGFPDQFGGEKGKKFKYKPFKNALLEMSNKSMDEQNNKLEDIFNTWKGELEQVDDVCIIGFKL